MLQLGKARGSQQGTPRLQVVIGAIAYAAPAFLVISSRSRAEQDTARLQGRVKLPKDPRQRLCRYVEQGSVGEYAVECVAGQFQRQEVLMPDFAPGFLASHGDKGRRTVES